MMKTDDAQSERFREMENIHRQYFPIFKNLCQQQKYSRSIQTMVDEFVIGRIGNKKGVRAFVFDQLYKLAGGKDDIPYILTAIELQLASMYCFNVAADTKAGYDSKEKIITSYQTQEIIYQLSLEAVDKFSKDNKLTKRIKEVFEKTQMAFLSGEVFDTLVNLYENIGKHPNELIIELKNISSEDWEMLGFRKEFAVNVIKELPDNPISDLTYQRTYGINAVMFENFGEIIGILLDLKSADVGRLKLYGKYFGLSMQIINDIQDYSLDLITNNGNATKEKDKKDVFSDLKKGKITWPIKFFLSEDIPGTKEILFEKVGNEEIKYDKCEQIRKTLVENGSMKKCVLEAAYYSKLANDAISDFNNKAIRKTLSEESASMAKFSKYVYLLEDKYTTILRPSHAQIRKRVLRGEMYM